MRVCDNCGTPLPGRKSHGFVRNGKLLCGRSETQATRTNREGERFLAKVKWGCRD